MFKRGFSLVACGALVLLLTAAESSRAQVFIGGNRGAFFWPGLSYPVGPTYVNYAHPYYYNPPPTYTGYQQYTMTTPTTLYYGAATPMYYGSYSPGYSTGLRGGSNIGAVGYETPSYPIQPPNYTMRYPVSPPLSVVTDNTAQIDVRLPAAAELWFEGQKTEQTGSNRTFRSPDLEPGQAYVYTVHAKWDAAGKSADETRKVTVHAGDHVVVSFTQPDK